MARLQGQILSMFGLFLLLIVGSVYAMSLMSAESEAVNVTGTPYEAAYNSSVATQGISLSLIGPLGLLAFVGVVILVVRNMKGRR